MDYRELSALMMKDKFLIPITDDLLDELFGANVFFKINLQEGYHQIGVREENIHKTTFRMHKATKNSK